MLRVKFMHREGRGATARARCFTNVTACRAVSNPAWCRIFREISCFSPLNIGTLFRCCVVWQGTLPSYASPDSSVNEYLVSRAVFHLVFSNMAQRHVAFCERHDALHERHVALHECHVTLHVRHAALLTFIQ